LIETTSTPVTLARTDLKKTFNSYKNWES